MVNCLVVNCHNAYKNTKGKGESFHKLPENGNLKKIWLAKIKREDAIPKPENCYVCSDHFIKDDFKLPQATRKWKFKENLAGKNKTRGRYTETRELLRLLGSLYQGRLQAEYSGMKVVFFDLHFKLKAMFTFHIFEMYFFLNFI